MSMNKKHLLLMLACCLIPLVALGAVFVLGASVNSVVFFGMMLVCPLLHFVMMRGMMGERTHTHADHAAGPADAARTAPES